MASILSQRLHPLGMVTLVGEGPEGVACQGQGPPALGAEPRNPLWPQFRALSTLEPVLLWDWFFLPRRSLELQSRTGLVGIRLLSPVGSKGLH